MTLTRKKEREKEKKMPSSVRQSSSNYRMVIYELIVLIIEGAV